MRHVIGLGTTAGFSAREKSGQKKSHPRNMCADLVLRLGVKKELSAKQRIMRICSYFFSPVRDPEAPFISLEGAVA